MKHDTSYTHPLTDIQAASDAIRTQGGMMVTHHADGSTTYGTPAGAVIHGRIAHQLIRSKFVVPSGADLFGDENRPQLYMAAIK